MAVALRLNPIDINLLYKRKTVRSLDIKSIIFPCLLVIVTIGGAISLYVAHSRLSSQILENQLDAQRVEKTITTEDSRLQEQHSLNPHIAQFLQLPEVLGAHYYPPTVVLAKLTKLLPMNVDVSDLNMKAYLIGPQQGTIDVQFNGSFQRLVDTEVFIHTINQSETFDLDQVETISKVIKEDGSSYYAVNMKLTYHE
jgi:hypothetical protein